MSVTILRKVSVTGGTVLRAANNLGDVASAATAFGNIKQSATTSATGVVELATNAEAVTGTDPARAVTPVAMKAGMASELNARALGQGITFNRTTRTEVVSPYIFPASLGTGDFTISLKVKFGASGAGDEHLISGAAGGMAIYRRSSQSDIVLAKVGVVAMGVLDYTSWVVGDVYEITISRSSGVLYAWVNGITQTISQLNPTASFSGETYKIGCREDNDPQFNGTLYRVVSFNRTLTDAQVQSLMKHGIDVSDIGASGVPASTQLITGDNSTFASDTGWWTKYDSTAISGGAATIPTGSRMRRTGLLTVGKRYKLTLVVSENTSTGIGIGVGSTYNVIGLLTGTGTLTLEFQYADSVGSGILQLESGGTGQTVIDSITCEAIGAVLLPEPNTPGNGLVWADCSGNGAHILLPTSGVSWVTPSNAANRIRGTTSTNGNQQLLSGACVPPNFQLIRARARARSGTPTITIGSTSGNNDWVTSVGLTTAWKNLTLAYNDGTGTGAGSLWIGSNSTDVVEIDVTLEPLGF